MYISEYYGMIMLYHRGRERPGGPELRAGDTQDEDGAGRKEDHDPWEQGQRTANSLNRVGTT